jgi:hypothetical protein
VATAEAALQRGLQELVWCSDGIDTYIKDTLELVRDLDGVLATIKDNVAKTVEILHSFERNLMFDRKVCCAVAGGRILLMLIDSLIKRGSKGQVMCAYACSMSVLSCVARQ